MHRLLSLAILASCANDTARPTGPALTGEEIELAWGSVALAPGEEGTRCLVVDVGNEDELFIHEIHNTISSTSHHLVIYQLADGATPVTSEPVPCHPFSGTLSPSAGASPLMITQKHDDLLTLPDGVAYTFAPHQKLRLELHYFNGTDTEQVASATTVLKVGTPELIEHEASFMFIGTPDIELPPGARSTVEAYFTPPESLAGVQYYAITGHTHALGTNVEVETARARTEERTPVYVPDAFLWSEPPTVRHDPAFRLADGGGFHFRCDYENTTAETVTFGESATAEMCFFWAYYYPSRGARLCVNSTLLNPEGTDVCCPADAGDPLAEFICQKLAEEFE